MRHAGSQFLYLKGTVWVKTWLLSQKVVFFSEIDTSLSGKLDLRIQAGSQSNRVMQLYIDGIWSTNFIR